MNDRNNPYPEGRWTPNSVSTSGPSTPAQARPTFARPAAEIIGAPLRELFWGLPESSLVEEARDRVERVIAAALARPAQQEARFA